MNLKFDDNNSDMVEKAVLHNENDVDSKSKKWRSKSFSRLFVIIGICLIFSGSTLLLICQLYFHGIASSVITNIAVSLIPAGTIIIAYEYYMRKEFISHLNDTLQEVL
ncbi:MAG: hypothetical protein P8Y81_15660, partial [Ignavibacteriaceae bacterium]